MPAALIFGGALLAGVVGWFSFDLTNPLRPGPLCVAGVAAFLMTIGLDFLRRVAERDPLMFEVAQRYYAFGKKFYPARTGNQLKESHVKINHKARRVSPICCRGASLATAAWCSPSKGMWLAGYYFQQPDNDSRTEEEAEGVVQADHVNTALTVFGAGLGIVGRRRVVPCWRLSARFSLDSRIRFPAPSMTAAGCALRRPARISRMTAPSYFVSAATASGVQARAPVLHRWRRQAPGDAATGHRHL